MDVRKLMKPIRSRSSASIAFPLEMEATKAEGARMTKQVATEERRPPAARESVTCSQCKWGKQFLSNQ